MAFRFAVDVGASRTMLAMVAPESPEIIAYDRPLTQEVFPTGQEPGQSLVSTIHRFLEKHRVELGEIAGFAVGVPGVVDRNRGHIYTCPNLHVLDDCALGETIEEQMDIPVHVDNNTNLIALGEFSAGSCRGTRDMAVIFVGSGVGCGLIINGRLYEGADGAASEFGHTNVVPGGRHCTCGAHGCLEMYCSAKAFDHDAEVLWGPPHGGNGVRFPGAQNLIEQAHAGHDGAEDYLDEGFYYMGLGITSLINMLNPRRVVMGGGIMLAWPNGLNLVRRVVEQEALPGVRRNLSIEMSELQHDAGVLGGAALVAAQGDMTGVGLA